MTDSVIHFHADKDNFDQLVLKSTVPVIVDFSAEWCGPCKKLGPELENRAKVSDKFKVVKIDIDENGDLAEQYNVSSIPYVILFVNGKKHSDFLGMDLNALDKMIASIQ